MLPEVCSECPSRTSADRNSRINDEANRSCVNAPTGNKVCITTSTVHTAICCRYYPVIDRHFRTRYGFRFRVVRRSTTTFSTTFFLSASVDRIPSSSTLSSSAVNRPSPGRTRYNTATNSEARGQLRCSRNPEFGSIACRDSRIPTTTTRVKNEATAVTCREMRRLLTSNRHPVGASDSARFSACIQRR